MPPRRSKNVGKRGKPAKSKGKASKQELQANMRKKLAERQGEKTICLTMIVKNESANMVRLLDSLESIIDMICIVDTGSTDDTPIIIEHWGMTHDMPTTVHSEPFRNFAYNRTHSAQMAKKTYPEADYLLLSDADFVWEIGNFDKVLLIDHKYLVDQKNNSLTYANIRLLSNRVDWVCLGRTHEYWTEADKQTEFKGNIRAHKITTLMIDDREDGGCKDDKFIRDERLLLEGLNDPEEPEHLKTRYKFYLAQTYKDLERHDKSVEWYQKRVKDGGWAEEVYYAEFQTGFNYEQWAWKIRHAAMLLDKKEQTEADKAYLVKWNSENKTAEELMSASTKNFTNAGVHYLKAYQYRKTRAESLYYATRMYRLLKMHAEAYQLACIGKDISYPSDSLFIERGCYDYLFLYEITIVAYYLPEHKDHGREAITQLMKRNDLPEHIAKSVENNSRFYI